MARFDVHRSRRTDGSLLVIVQADMFNSLDTRLAIPLLPTRKGRTPLARLNPPVEISGEPYVVYTQHMLAVPVEQLGAPIANIAEHRDDIVAAVDFLQQGF